MSDKYMRTFLRSSTSSALRISHPLLSTIASLASRLTSSSSFALNNALVRFSVSTGFLANSVTRTGIGIRGDDGPAIGDDGCVDVRPDSTESREDWNDELPVSSSDLVELDAPGTGRWRSLRKKSAAVVVFGLSSSAVPLGGGEDVGGHDGFEDTFSGFVDPELGGGDEGGRGEVWEDGVPAVPPPKYRRTPFISLCSLLW